jgi:hypothetical protein
MKVSRIPVPVASGPVEVCYACQRHFHPDHMSGCVVCGESLCLDLPSCTGMCRCDEEAERTGKPSAYKPQDAVTV